MTDDATPPLPPDRAEGPEALRDRVRRDVAVLAELAASGLVVDGQLQVATSSWFVYGRTTYDGEVVVGRYQDAVEAAEVLRAALHLPRQEGQT
jgi:hypothetical protein